MATGNNGECDMTKHVGNQSRIKELENRVFKLEGWVKKLIAMSRPSHAPKMGSKHDNTWRIVQTAGVDIDKAMADRQPADIDDLLKRKGKHE